jgi:hypothetical protein
VWVIAFDPSLSLSLLHLPLTLTTILCIVCLFCFPGHQKPPRAVLWRADQSGDMVKVPHGGAVAVNEAGHHQGDAEDVRLDQIVPLKRGHGFRCNETREWKPCYNTCDNVHGHAKSVKRR